MLSAALLSLFASCGPVPADEDFEAIVAAVTETNHFGDVFLDIDDIDLEYGDSVNISCSNGYEADAIPYYPDFFGSHDTTVLSDLFGSLCLGQPADNLNETACIAPGDTITITLDGRGKYKQLYDAYNIDTGMEQREGQSDSDFLNARPLDQGEIREDYVYRGASPFNRKYGRVALMGAYLEEHGIAYILDLADTPEKILADEADYPEYTKALIDNGQVKAIHLGLDFSSAESMAALRDGLVSLSRAEGPYFIHCSLGRDRTGFVCALLEALCGADYNEIIDDYMKSYDDLHDIDMDPDSLQYQLFLERLYDMFERFIGLGRDEIKTADLRSAARDYLIRCKMTEDEIDRLIRSIT